MAQMAAGDTSGLGDSVTYASGNTSGPPDIRMIHYNDVYHVEAGSREPVGGIARFQTLCDHYQQDKQFNGQPELLTFFSGDAFNPSLESSVTKGKHMLGPLNNLRTSVACLGNHDLDFGVDQFKYLASQCRFPWLCANVLDPALGDNIPLGGCKRTVMLESSNGIKLGVIGLVEREWLDTINTLPPNLQYHSASATAADLAPSLRAQGADLIVCITHQREPNDNKLASKLEPGTVDIILGGHDHFYNHTLINGTHVLRSGTDFKQLSYLECRRKPNGEKGWDIDIVRRDVVGSIVEEPSAAAMVDKITESLRSKLEKPIGYTLTPLDARFTTVRLKESNLGNFVCDLIRLHYDADCAIMAAGTIRGDQIYPPGVLRLKEIMACFPFEDPTVVIELSGSDIVGALENAVGKYPSLEGRFPQVSNICFTFDPAKTPGRRCSDITIGGQPVDLVKSYTLVTRDYMCRGKDGFTDLMLESEGGKAKSIVNEENGLLLSMILRQYFMSLKVLGRWTHWGHHLQRHWQRVHDPLHEVHPVHEPVQPGAEIPKDNTQPGNVQEIPSLVGRAQRKTGSKRRKLNHAEEAHLVHSDSEDDHTDLPAVPATTDRERELILMRKVMRKWWRLAGMDGHPALCDHQDETFGVHWTRGIAPRVEGRIKIVGVES